MRARQSGFTLIEMSIVIVLVAAIIGAVAVIFASMLKKYQYKETIAKMETIQAALYEYRISFNTLPCPADVTFPLGHTHFGVAAANLGSCTGGVPAANFTGSDATPQEIRQGMVPTQSLQLSDEYAFDGWGRRIMYTVNRDLTQVGAFNIVGGYDPTTRMTINNDQGVANTTLAGYVIWSAGANGHGAYPRKGDTTRVSAGSVNAAEQENCDCDDTAAATALNNIFVQQDPSLNPTDSLDAYDDVVMFATRVDMILQSSMAWSVGPQYTFSPTGGVGGRTGRVY
ncbi:MAG: type II secretion system GspH family protein [Rickettsiales bacterium]|nr:type II secretion system GspH family protein [Rickettsiales bacterium]